MDEYPSEYDPRFPLRTGGQLDSGRQHYRRCPAGEWIPGALDTPGPPVLLPSLTYAEASDRKTIRVYHDLDVRFALEDFYSKLALCYPR